MTNSEEDVLFGRGDSGQWARYCRTDESNTVNFAVFQVWDQGERNLFCGMENTKLHSLMEAQSYLDDLDRGDVEIECLRNLLEGNSCDSRSENRN
jgi:hypothetical protein